MKALVDLHGEVVAGTDEEVVADHVPDHLLVEVAVVDVLPVRVLHKATGQIENIIFLIFLEGGWG